MIINEQKEINNNANRWDCNIPKKEGSHTPYLIKSLCTKRPYSKRNKKTAKSENIRD
jgi:hypothetical protein